MKVKFNPDWSDMIQMNNPEPYRYSGVGNTSDWYWEIHCNNPSVLPPDYNPSQYEFDIVWYHLVNKKRGLHVITCGRVRSVKKITKLTPNLTNHSHRKGFNFSK